MSNSIATLRANRCRLVKLFKIKFENIKSISLQSTTHRKYKEIDLKVTKIQVLQYFESEKCTIYPIN